MFYIRAPLNSGVLYKGALKLWWNVRWYYAENGGSAGDSHGRRDPAEAAHAGQWQVAESAPPLTDNCVEIWCFT